MVEETIFVIFILETAAPVASIKAAFLLRSRIPNRNMVHLTRNAIRLDKILGTSNQVFKLFSWDDVKRNIVPI